MSFEGVPVATFDELCPERHRLCQNLPEDLDGAGMSNFFFGRDDRVIFLSMWACLWTGVRQDKTNKELAKIIDWIHSGKFIAKVRALRVEWGVTPHPAKVVEGLEADESSGG